MSGGKRQDQALLCAAFTHEFGRAVGVGSDSWKVPVGSIGRSVGGELNADASRVVVIVAEGGVPLELFGSGQLTKAENT